MFLFYDIQLFCFLLFYWVVVTDRAGSTVPYGAVLIRHTQYHSSVIHYFISIVFNYVAVLSFLLCSVQCCGVLEMVEIAIYIIFHCTPHPSSLLYLYLSYSTLLQSVLLLYFSPLSVILFFHNNSLHCSFPHTKLFPLFCGKIGIFLSLLALVL